MHAASLQLLTELVATVVVDMDSSWEALSHLPKHYVEPFKTMTMSEMLAPLPRDRAEVETSSAGGAQQAASQFGPSATTIDDNTPHYVDHKVTKSDTLFGLSLKYGVPINTIKQMNDLHSDNIATVGVLRIPVGKVLSAPAGTGKESERAILRRFRNTHGVTEAEAKYYLSEHAFNYDKATDELQRDLAFERQSGAAVEMVTAAAAVPTRSRATATAAIATGSGSSASSNWQGGAATAGGHEENDSLLSRSDARQGVGHSSGVSAGTGLDLGLLRRRLLGPGDVGHRG